GIEDRPPFVRRAALASRDTTHHGRAVRRRRLGVKGPLTSGESLDNQSRLLINEDRHSSQEPPRKTRKPRNTRKRILLGFLRVFRVFVSFVASAQPASSTTLLAASSMLSAVVSFIPL